MKCYVNGQVGLWTVGHFSCYGTLLTTYGLSGVMMSHHQGALRRLFLNLGCGSRVANENTRHADYDVVGFPLYAH